MPGADGFPNFEWSVRGSKLACVLVEAARSHRLRELPGIRVAMLEEAVAVAEALDVANPFRAKVLAKALEAHRQ
ncbi:hypothetical protein, partial [Saccharothrix sp. ST-888]|uniref:hypothetical protein n=1 Tax=Saccharothrix sp. ST-888 TaxID=1427391 RepID=UPI0018CE9E42